MTYWKKVKQEDAMKHQLGRHGTFLIIHYTIQVNQAKYVLYMFVVLNLKGSQQTKSYCQVQT